MTATAMEARGKHTARYHAVFLLAACLPCVQGCVATQRDVVELQNQTDELKFQVIDLKKTINSLQANQADLAVNMKQLHTDLGVFTETVKDLQTNMDKLSSKIDDLGSGIANVGTGITSKVTALGETIKEGVEQQKKDVEKVERKVAQAGAMPSPTELFHTAEVRLAKKDFDLAARGFEEYAARFPNGALVDVAAYNLGEALYGQGKWEPAGRQFAAVLERYPKSQMIPSARLLYALCLINLKKNIPEAKQYLESIPQDYPASQEAKAAVEQLKKLAPRDRPARRSKS
ncbi:MAG: tetratricopeptide repeat protein [Elusimicrobia bacterium]|nr:tetratricopeptide repeat protein [Elusimicrobiota bacterium]